MEELARGCVDRFHLRGLEWVRVRKAGRVFVLVSFFLDPDRPAQEMDQIRQAMTDHLARLNPDLDLGVLFKTR